MDIIKTTKDLRFILSYDDGTVGAVNKGILFEETNDGFVNVHIGTDNLANMLVAVINVVGEMLGLEDDRK